MTTPSTDTRMAFWTIRRSLAAVGMLALSAVVAGQFWISASYRSLAFDAFTEQQTRMVRLLAEDRIRVRYDEKARELTADWARGDALTKAMAGSDVARMGIEAEALFAQAAVTLGEIILVGAHVFAPDLTPQASAARGLQNSMLDDTALRDRLAARDRGQARQATTLLWSGPDGRPLHSVLLPIGGFRVQGYLEVITDPLPTLTGLAQAFGGDITVEDMQGSLRLTDRAVVLDTNATADAAAPASPPAENAAPDTLQAPSGSMLVPVTLQDSAGKDWAKVTLASDISAFTGELDRTRNTALVGLVVLVLGLGLVTLILLRQTVFRVLKDFAGAMIAIAEDREASIPRTGADEMASMAKALEVLRERSAELKIAQHSQREEAEAHQREIRERLRNLSETLARELDETVGPVLRQTQELTGVSNALTNAAVAMQERSDAVGRSALEATDKTVSISAAAHRMADAIQLVRDRAGRSRDIAETASGEVTGAQTMVELLADAAREIDAVVTLITDIAGQTNLLALNATIEAARAGEAGKGFAVVAHEVKSLAGRTSQATGDISTKVEEVQSRTRSAVNAIGTIAETIQRMTSMAAEIAQTVDAQEDATRQMIADTEAASGNTRTVSGDIGEVGERSQAVGELAGSVSKAALAVNEGLDRLRQGLDRIARDAQADAG